MDTRRSATGLFLILSALAFGLSANAANSAFSGTVFGELAKGACDQRCPGHGGLPTSGAQFIAGRRHTGRRGAAPSKSIGHVP